MNFSNRSANPLNASDRRGRKVLPADDNCKNALTNELIPGAIFEIATATLSNSRDNWNAFRSEPRFSSADLTAPLMDPAIFDKPSCNNGRRLFAKLTTESPNPSNREDDTDF